MQSVDAYTMFMVWTLAPHMVDTQSQTVLFKSVIPVPDTPSESPVNRNVILWDDTRYFQKPLDQAYHGDCSHATASSGTVASVSKLHQSDMGHPRMSSGCLVSPKNRKDRRISISGLKEASSRSSADLRNRFQYSRYLSIASSELRASYSWVDKNCLRNTPCLISGYISSYCEMQLRRTVAFGA
ncbi:hypothetical protein V2W45_337037 [Cenococcum geophilum]